MIDFCQTCDKPHTTVELGLDIVNLGGLKRKKLGGRNDLVLTLGLSGKGH